MPFQRGNKLGKGRPRRGRSFTDLLQVALHEKRDGKPRLRVIVDQLVSKAEAGDLSAIKEIADRLEGKVKVGMEEGASQAVIVHFDKLLSGVL